MAGIGLAVFSVWIGAIIAGVLFLVISGMWIVYLALTYSGDSFAWVRTTEAQLTADEAKTLVLHKLLYDENTRLREVFGYDTPLMNARGGATNVRLFTLKGKKLNSEQYVGVVVDLEKEISISNLESHEERDRAVAEFDNMATVTAQTRNDLEEKMEERKKEIGKSLTRTVTRRRYEDGKLVTEEEQPALTGGPDRALPEQAGPEQEEEG